MTPAKPSLELLRSLTDEHVLRALVADPRLTRAEIAARTGISKPTVGESVRRLTEAGLLRDTGERTTGRGRIGSYYALAENLGVALVVSIAPDLRLFRSFVLDEVNQDYVRTARAKGLPERRVVWVHVLRNAAIPIITHVMANLPALLIGAFLLVTLRTFFFPG